MPRPGTYQPLSRKARKLLAQLRRATHHAVQMALIKELAHELGKRRSRGLARVKDLRASLRKRMRGSSWGIVRAAGNIGTHATCCGQTFHDKALARAHATAHARNGHGAPPVTARTAPGHGRRRQHITGRDLKAQAKAGRAARRDARARPTAGPSRNDPRAGQGQPAPAARGKSPAATPSRHPGGAAAPGTSVPGLRPSYRPGVPWRKLPASERAFHSSGHLLGYTPGLDDIARTFQPKAPAKAAPAARSVPPLPSQTIRPRTPRAPRAAIKAKTTRIRLPKLGRTAR